MGQAANQHPLASGCRYLVNGEPTDSWSAPRIAACPACGSPPPAAPRHVRPEMGESAIDKLIDALRAARAAIARRRLAQTNALHGRTISGGVAPNVVSPHAEAGVMFRTVGAFSDLQPALDALTPRVGLETLLEVPAVRLTMIDGFKTMSFPSRRTFRSGRVGKPLLFRPGSILVAPADRSTSRSTSSRRPPPRIRRSRGSCLPSNSHRFRRSHRFFRSRRGGTEFSPCGGRRRP
jgi:hypothetical protein